MWTDVLLFVLLFDEGPVTSLGHWLCLLFLGLQSCQNNRQTHVPQHMTPALWHSAKWQPWDNSHYQTGGSLPAPATSEGWGIWNSWWTSDPLQLSKSQLLGFLEWSMAWCTPVSLFLDVGQWRGSEEPQHLASNRECKNKFHNKLHFPELPDATRLNGLNLFWSTDSGDAGWSSLSWLLNAKASRAGPLTSCHKARMGEGSYWAC